MKLLPAVLVLLAAAAAWVVWRPRGTVLLRGSFHSVAHRGQGEARVVQDGGARRLEIRDLETYESPGLEICLIRATDAEESETTRATPMTCLGPWQPARKQAYGLPVNLDLETYRAVVVWKAAGSVNFTTAPLRRP